MIKTVDKWFWINIGLLLLLSVMSCVLVSQRFNTRYSYNYLSHLQQMSAEMNNQYLKLLLENRAYDITATLDSKSNNMVVPSKDKILVLK